MGLFTYNTEWMSYYKGILYNESQLELMFMKHYAPNRCLYIKVAKLRTGVGRGGGRWGGGGGVGVGLGGQSGCELRIEVFVKIQKKKLGGGGGGSVWGGGGGVGGGVRVDVNEELKFL